MYVKLNVFAAMYIILYTHTYTHTHTHIHTHIHTHTYTHTHTHTHTCTHTYTYMYYIAGNFGTDKFGEFILLSIWQKVQRMNKSARRVLIVSANF